MAKHPAVEIKTAIEAAQSAITEQQRLDLSLSQRARSFRRELGERLQSVFADVGLDVEIIKKILAEHQREVLSVRAEEKSKTAKTFAALDENLQRGIENRRKALEQLANKPLIATSIPLWTANEIVAFPGNTFPFASHIEASNNWAVIAFEREEVLAADRIDGLGKIGVNFFFIWENPSQKQPAVINADSDLVLQGTAYAQATAGLFVSGEGFLDLTAQLSVVVGRTILNSTPLPIKKLDVTGDPVKWTFPGYWSLDATFSDTYHLSNQNIFVPPGELVVVLVRFQTIYFVDSGRVELDFESSGGSIKCPSVQLELVTPEILP
jgi:hypothetical protein